MERVRIFCSLAFRLTLWYSAVLVSVALLCFGLAYFLFQSMILHRTDRFLREELAGYRRAYAEHQFEGLTLQVTRAVQATGTADLFVRILRRDGTTVYASDLDEWQRDLAPHQRLTLPPPGGSRAESWDNLPQHLSARVLTAPVGDDLVAQIGMSLKGEQQSLRELERIAGVFTFVALAVAVLVGWLMARRALSGVHMITATATVIAGGVLERRVPTSGWHDEVDVLATNFNRMVDRISGLIEGIKQTNDNIAHELRSPITRMRGFAEMSLADAPGGSPYHALALNTLEESDRLLALINTMLDIAEVEAGVVRLALHPVDLAAVVQDACEIFEPVAEETQITLRAVVQGPIMVLGDLPKLQRAVSNLIDNALKYSPRGGQVTAEVTADAPVARITVSDTGPGIAEADMPHLFQRFYRGEKSRTRKGYGLGLSLARAIVNAHRGSIRAENIPGQGAKFIIALPQTQ